MMGLDFTGQSFWLFQLTFCSASATIVAGTLAERCQMVSYLAYSLMLAGFVYPVVVHSIWSPSGFLSPNRYSNVLWDVGMVDFAGSAVVHITGGLTALIATKLLGPRTGRFYDLRGKALKTPKEIIGHSMPMQMLGVSRIYPCLKPSLSFRSMNCLTYISRSFSRFSSSGLAGMVSILVVSSFSLSTSITHS